MIERFHFKPTTIAALQGEMRRAVDKHGIERTPLVELNVACLPILVEELGEIARALTYDNGDRDKLAAELLQTATMALAWYQRVVYE